MLSNFGNNFGKFGFNDRFDRFAIPLSDIASGIGANRVPPVGAWRVWGILALLGEARTRCLLHLGDHWALKRDTPTAANGHAT